MNNFENLQMFLAPFRERKYNHTLEHLVAPKCATVGFQPTLSD